MDFKSFWEFERGREEVKIVMKKNERFGFGKFEGYGEGTCKRDKEDIERESGWDVENLTRGRNKEEGVL